MVPHPTGRKAELSERSVGRAGSGGVRGCKMLLMCLFKSSRTQGHVRKIVCRIIVV